MTGFELVFITDPGLNDKDLESLQKNIKISLTKSKGNSSMSMYGDVEDWHMRLRGMILVFITHGTSRGVVKQLMNYNDNLDIQIMFYDIRLLK